MTANPLQIHRVFSCSSLICYHSAIWLMFCIVVDILCDWSNWNRQLLRPYLKGPWRQKLVSNNQHSLCVNASHIVTLYTKIKLPYFVMRSLIRELRKSLSTKLSGDLLVYFLLEQNMRRKLNSQTEDTNSLWQKLCNYLWSINLKSISLKGLLLTNIKWVRIYRTRALLHTFLIKAKLAALVWFCAQHATLN